jgi:hypothetical protein
MRHSCSNRQRSEEWRLDAYELDPHRLSDEWPSVPIPLRSLNADEGYVVVYVAHNRIEADLLRQQIEARGVQCRVEKRVDFQAGGYIFNVNRIAQLCIIVPAADEKAAREIVNHFRRKASNAPSAPAPPEESAN